MRGVRRSIYLDSTVEEQLDTAVERLRWDRFAKRFEEDCCNGVRVEDMNPEKFGGEQCASYSAFFRRMISRKIEEEGLSEDEDTDNDDDSDSERKTHVKIKRILTFQTNQTKNTKHDSGSGNNFSTTSSRRRAERERENRMSSGGSNNEVSLPAAHLKGVADLLIAIQNNHQTRAKFQGMSTGIPTGSHGSANGKPTFHQTTRAVASNVDELPLYPASFLLSSKAFSWTLLGGIGVRKDLRLSQSTATLPPVGCRVYYCIEEREYYRKKAGKTNLGGSAAFRKNVNTNENADNDDSILPPPTPPENSTNKKNSSYHHNRGGKSGASADGSNSKKNCRELTFITNSTSILHNFISTLYDCGLSDSEMEEFSAIVGDDNSAPNNPSSLKFITCGKVCNKHHKISADEQNSKDSSSDKVDQQDIDSILSYPDVLEAKYRSSSGTVTKLHFAPATIMHLLETTHAAEYKKQLPLHQAVELDNAYPVDLIATGCIKNLFVPLENDENALGKNLLKVDEDINLSNNNNNNSIYSKLNKKNRRKDENFSRDPLVNSQVAPLSDKSMRELLAAYVARNRDQNLNQGVGGIDKNVVNIDADVRLPSCAELLPDVAVSVLDKAKKRVMAGLPPEDNGKKKPKWRFTIPNAKNDKKKAKEKRIDRTTHKYCVIFNPKPPLPENREFYSLDDENNVVDNFPKIDWGTTTASLIQYTMSDNPNAGHGNVLEADFENENSGVGGSGLTVRKKSVKKKWDNAILSNFCRWRACLSNSTSLNTPKYLCTMHSDLKLYLDNNINKSGSSESSKFLPKKPPQTGATSDLHLIKCASSLLQELENGKLAATIKSFCKRAAAESSEKYVWKLVVLNNPNSHFNNPQRLTREREMRERERLEREEEEEGGVGEGGGGERNHDVYDDDTIYSQQQSDMNNYNKLLSELTWSRWLKTDELAKTKNLLSKELTAANQIHSTERAVTSELSRLRELGVYPTAELALIRRQFKSLEKEWQERHGGEGADLADDNNDGSGGDKTGPDDGTGNADGGNTGGDNNNDHNDEKLTWDSNGTQTAGDGGAVKDLELEFCERKRQLLRHRRQEAEGERISNQQRGYGNYSYSYNSSSTRSLYNEGRKGGDGGMYFGGASNSNSHNNSNHNNDVDDEKEREREAREQREQHVANHHPNHPGVSARGDDPSPYLTNMRKKNGRRSSNGY